MGDFARKGLDDITVGSAETFTKTVTEADIAAWVGLAEDMNPVHTDRAFAEAAGFDGVIAPGIFVAAFISTVMTKLTFGNIYAGQTLKFIKPVYVGDTVTAVATVVGKTPETRRVTVRTECFNQRGETVIAGEGRVYIVQV